MLRVVCRSLAIVLLCAVTLPAAEVERIEATHEGVTVRVAIAPSGARLAHTTELLPADVKADLPAQLESVMKSLDDVLAKVGASRESLLRVNLYAATPEAAAEGRKTIETAMKCPVTLVVTDLPEAGALVAIDAVAVAKADRSPDPAVVRLMDADRGVYISGMAAPAKGIAEATRGTYKQLDGVLRHLGIPRTNVTCVKSFLRAEPGALEAARTEMARYFEGSPPPAAWVHWTSQDAIEIELFAELPKTNEATTAPSSATGPTTTSPPTTTPTDTVTFLTPPGAVTSPLYSKVAIVHPGGRLFYTSGIAAGAADRDAQAETRAALAALKEAVTKAGGDLEHLVKATYYPATDATTAALTKVRPEFYDPKRPPAASRAQVRSTGVVGSQITFDLIAVTTLADEGSGSAKPRAAGERVTLEEFESLRKQKDVVVLDVRSPDEFAEGHVPGATNMNVQDKRFADRAAALDKSKTYVVYCQSGARSTRAAAKLKGLGFEKLLNFAGSMNAWNAAGKPVEKVDSSKK